MTGYLSTDRRVTIASTLLLIAMVMHAVPGLASRLEPGEISYPSFIGRVLQITSGNSLQMVLVDGRAVIGSLAGLQAPVEGQPFAQHSHRWLQQQLAGQIVSIDCEPKSVEGPRLLCVVYPDERDINYLALRFGIARTLEAELRIGEMSGVLDADRYRAAESIAHRTKLGMWAVETLSAISP